LAVALGHPAVPAAAVPEAAVNEYGQALTAEHEIRAAWQGLVPTPAGDPGGAENGGQSKLGVFVPFRADCGHYLRTLLLCQDIGHGREYTRIPGKLKRRARTFLTERLVGMDDDPFCVSCARELLTFLYPQHAGNFLVFLHNTLYQQAPKASEIIEDGRAEAHLAPGRYDLVLGNPPGNDEYSGTNRAEIERQWERRFGHTEGGLMDHHCFIRRAVELAKPKGGRICLLVPEGLLTRDNRGMPALRLALARAGELRLVISLPRAFKDNNARMAIVYLVRSPRTAPNRKTVLAEVREKWWDAEGAEKTTDLFGELETIVGHHLEP